MSRTQSKSVYHGRIEKCPKCGEWGYLFEYVMTYIPTGAQWKYFTIRHSLPKKKWREHFIKGSGHQHRKPAKRPSSEVLKEVGLEEELRFGVYQY